MQRRDIGRDAFLDIDDAWLDPYEATALACELEALIPWEHLPINVFGREILQPRLMAWGGDVPYRYSGLTLAPRPMSPTLDVLTWRIGQLAGVPFNHVMLNLYRDGMDHMGMHADDERELGRDPVVASLSLGARRRFVLKPKNRKLKKKVEVPLVHGGLIVMGGACQHTWYHGVPRQAGVRQSRINLTFRWIKGPPGWREPQPDLR